MKLIEMVVEPTLIFNHLIIDTGKRKVYYTKEPSTQTSTFFIEFTNTHPKSDDQTDLP